MYMNKRIYTLCIIYLSGGTCENGEKIHHVDLFCTVCCLFAHVGSDVKPQFVRCNGFEILLYYLRGQCLSVRRYQCVGIIAVSLICICM